MLQSFTNAIEPRNVFIQKEILKNIVNLPARYKINRNNHKLFQLKPLLKKIFLKYYSKDLIFKKQGFSGYPNELKPILKDKKFQTIENLNILKKIKFKNNNKLEWKLINLQIFIENFIKKMYSFRKKIDQKLINSFEKLNKFKIEKHDTEKSILLIDRNLPEPNLLSAYFSYILNKKYKYNIFLLTNQGRDNQLNKIYKSFKIQNVFYINIKQNTLKF